MALDIRSTGFGIAGALDHAIVRELAPHVEAAGFRTLWVNDTPHGDALASLQIAAAVTSRIRLATGVINVDRRPAGSVVGDVQARDLPLDRLTIGIGASKPPHPLATASEAIQTLRERLNVPIVVGALGPRMRRLGVQEADGLLLNWLTPDGARAAKADAERDRAETDGPPPHVGLYIRVALGEESGIVLRAEADRYAAIPSYAANFARLGITALDTAIAVNTPEELREGIAAFAGTVDEPVVRAITATDALNEYIALIEAVAG